MRVGLCSVRTRKGVLALKPDTEGEDAFEVADHRGLADLVEPPLGRVGVVRVE